MGTMGKDGHGKDVPYVYISIGTEVLVQYTSVGRRVDKSAAGSGTSFCHPLPH